MTPPQAATDVAILVFSTVWKRGHRTMTERAMTDVTQILSEIESGDPNAAAELLPLVYEELRKLAAAKLNHEKPGQTLQATALVHEAYLCGNDAGRDRRCPWAVTRNCLPPMGLRTSNHSAFPGGLRFWTFRDGRPVLFSCPGGELLGDQVLLRNFFLADGHDDDSRAVDIRFPCPAPSADSLRMASCMASCMASRRFW